MKKEILLIPLIAGFAYITLTSSASGGARNSGVDGTIATGGSGCSCHTHNTSTTVTVELDSAGVAVTHYKPGMSYTIKVTGTNTSTSSLPKFGFQVTVVNSSGAGTSSAVFAGALGTTGLPSGTRYTSAASGCGIDVLEQSLAQAATTGGGTTGSTYVKSGLPWTAPATGTGTVIIYGCINAVNGTGSTGGDRWNNGSTSIAEWPATASITTVSNDINVKVFPNPVSNNLNLRLENAQTGNYLLQVFDLNAKNINNEIIEASSTSQTATINTDNWAPGMYQVVVEKDGIRKVIPVVKK